MKQIVCFICLLFVSTAYAQVDYNSTLPGAQVDSGAAIGNAVGAVNGIVKMDGAGTPSAASAVTDYLAPGAIGVTVQAYDADLDTAATATGSGNSKYFGTSAAGVVGFHSLPAADLGFTVDAPGAAGGVLISDGAKWERKAAFTGSIGLGAGTVSLTGTTSTGTLQRYLTLDTDLSSVSGSDDTVPSAKAVKNRTQYKSWSFDPKAVCDGSVDRLFLMRAHGGQGVVVTKWAISFEADPTTEVDLDLKRADAWIGVANAAVMDVLDTTNGAATEATPANINGGAAVAEGKVIYLEFGTAYTEENHQIIFEMWFYEVGN